MTVRGHLTPDASPQWSDTDLESPHTNQHTNTMCTHNTLTTYLNPHMQTDANKCYTNAHTHVPVCFQHLYLKENTIYGRCGLRKLRVCGQLRYSTRYS